MSITLEASRSGRHEVIVSFDLARASHRVFYIGSHELPFVEDIFRFFLTFVEAPGSAQEVLVPEACAYGGRHRRIFLRAQPHHSVFPIAIGEERLHATDVPTLFAYLVLAHYYVEEAPPSFAALVKLIPEDRLPIVTDLEPCARWFRERFSYVEEQIRIHVLNEGVPRRPRNELRLFRTNFAGHELIEARRYLDGEPARLTADSKGPEDPDLAKYVTNNVGAAFEIPYLKEFHLPTVSVEEYARSIGVSPKHVRAGEDTRLHCGLPYIMVAPGIRHFVRCWRCSRLLKADPAHMRHSDCACGAMNLAPIQGVPSVGIGRLSEQSRTDVLVD